MALFPGSKRIFQDVIRDGKKIGLMKEKGVSALNKIIRVLTMFGGTAAGIAWTAVI